MTKEQMVAINERIDAMIGTREFVRKVSENMRLSEKIDYRGRYEKMREKLFKIAEKGGEKALTMTIVDRGRSSTGLTAKGKKYHYEGNNGMTERSRYCGSLWVEGEGIVFTSGTIAKVFEYIINN